MRLAIGGMDAVRVLRALRGGGVDLHDLRRADLCNPDATPGKRFRTGSLDLDTLRLDAAPSRERPLCVVVPSRKDALRASWASNVLIRPTSVPAGSFVEVGAGIQIPCPELLFLQMGARMMPAIHLAFGLELCGSFSRDAQRPVDGSTRYGIPSATDMAHILVYLGQCRSVQGISMARRLAPYLSDNAWSPMEAVMASLLALPFEDLGYDLAPLTLNRRIVGGKQTPGARDSRVPDILFTGTPVGFNYDGFEHLGIDEVVESAIQAALDPGDSDLSRQLSAARGKVRAKYVDDNRRDRELLAQGMQVIPVTYEDLVEEGGMDQLVLWAIGRIEVAGGRDLSHQRNMLGSSALAYRRQLLVWSLLPGNIGRAARTELARIQESETHPTTEVHEATVLG